MNNFLSFKPWWKDNRGCHILHKLGEKVFNII